MARQPLPHSPRRNPLPVNAMKNLEHITDFATATALPSAMELVSGIENWIIGESQEMARRCGVDAADDLAQVGRLEALRAAPRFDAGRGVTFIGFCKLGVLTKMRCAAVRIRNPLNVCGGNYSSDVQVIRLNQAVGIRNLWSVEDHSREAEEIFKMMDDLETDAQALRHDFERVLREGLQRLSPQQRAVIEGVFLQGLDQGAIASRMGCSQQRVSQIKQKALRRLRNMPEIKQLKNS